MTTTVLGPRALNRALLERQLLARRDPRPVADAIAHLVGVHAQVPAGPYVGLWSRLDGFAFEDLATQLRERALVRTALQRSTIHLVTAADCLGLRPLVQPVLDRDLFGNATHGPPMHGLDLDEVVTAGRAALDEQPRTPAELGALLAQRWPDRPAAALAYAVRNLAALVQVPPRGIWGASGKTRHATAETWLGRPLDPRPCIETMVLRYLAAFGPATVADVQAWCGLTRLREVLDRLRPQLAVFGHGQAGPVGEVGDGCGSVAGEEAGGERSEGVVVRQVSLTWCPLRREGEGLFAVLVGAGAQQPGLAEVGEEEVRGRASCRALSRSASSICHPC